MCAARNSLSPPQLLWKTIPKEQLFKPDGKIHLEALLLHFSRGGRLSLADAHIIVDHAVTIISESSNVPRLGGAFSVVGDLHGQFYDLAKIVRHCGFFSSRKYLFLGNCIGGGRFNCETILTLLAAKTAFPGNVTILRGPNESRKACRTFKFEEECKLKYDKPLYLKLLEVFKALPLAAVLNQSIFCVHGGLSPDIEIIDDISSLNRVREIPSRGALCDLLWADPDYDVDNPRPDDCHGVDETYIPSTEYCNSPPRFVPNLKRGKSVVFSFGSVTSFMSTNKIFCIIRSHEVLELGYKLYRPYPPTNSPCIISVFSAPNYCGKCGNLGAVINIDSEITIMKFFCSPSPFFLQGENVLMRSASFVVENIVSLFSSIVEFTES